MGDNSDDDILELPNIGVEYPQYQRIPPPSFSGRKKEGTGGPPPGIPGRSVSAAPVTIGPRGNPGFPRHVNGSQNGGSTTAFPQYPGPGMVPGATAGMVPGASSVPEDFAGARVSRFSRGKWTSGIDHGVYNYNQPQQTSAGQVMNYNPSGSRNYGEMNDFTSGNPVVNRNKSGAIDNNMSMGELINDIKKSNNKRRRDESVYDNSIEVVDLDTELPDLFTPEARARLTQNENSNNSADYFNSIDFHSEKSNSPELLGYIPPKKGRVRKSNTAKKATGKKRGPKKKSETAMDAVNAMMSLANGGHLERAGPSGYYPPNQSNSGTEELEVLRSMIRQMQSMQHQMPGYHTNESVKESETYMLLLKGLDALKKRSKHTYLLNREVKCQQHRAGGIGPRVICDVCHWPGDIQLAFVDNQIQTDMVKDFLKSPKNDVWENLIYSVFSDGRLGSNSVLHVDNYGQMWRNHLKDSNKMEMLGPSSGAGGPPQRIAPPSMAASYEAMSFPQLHEDEEEEDNDMGVAETYADYMPRKLDIGKKHPDTVIETASMSSVEPPDITYTLGLPEKTIEESKLSALQLESIVYASQAHEKMLMDGNRAGFLIGDGAGVGKGRTVAGVIFENWRKGRKKHIWVSVSNDLKYDAERDLKDIGAGDIQVQSLSKVKYGKIKELKDGGVIFSTYSALIAERSSGGGQFNSRLKQLVNWCGGKSFDGCIIFDECHRAKNLYTKGKGEPTKTGWTVLNIQTMLPNARVVYASATGASEPKDMAYMVRLGLWGEGAVFREFGDFFQAVDKRGVGAMEIVAMDMKLRGMYIARQLSFNGVSFRIEEVALSPAYKESYNAAVKVWVSAMHMFLQAAQLIKGTDKRRSTSMWRQFWAAHQRFFKYLCIGAKVNFVVALGRKSVSEGKCVVIGLQSTGETRMAEQYEADAETFEFASSAKGVLENLVEKHFPGPSISKEEREKLVYGEKRKPPPKKVDKVKPPPPPPIKRAYDSCEDSDDSDILIISDGEDKAGDSDSDISILSEHIESRPNGNFENGLHYHNFQDLEEADFYADIPWSDLTTVMRLKCDLLNKIDDLGKKLPPNTLDQLISELGGPKKVAEMTGRKKRVVKDASGRVVYEDRSEQDVPLEILNLKEKERFMNGDKLIAIISEAASSGISLQSDRRVKNQRRRVHMTLELPWSADRAIQQFGRTHRSNQANGPEYVFLISELAGERRFASIVAKRLESLGALTHGDRRATTDTRDLTSFNIDNKYGRLAVEAAMSGMMGLETPLVPPPEDYKGSFFQDCCEALTGVGIVEDDGGTVRLHKDYNNLGKFLNRILGTPVDIQNRLFSYFTKTMAAILLQAKRSGKYDLGILDISSGTECKKIKTKTWETRHPTGKANINLHTVTVERGMAWKESLDKFLAKQDADELDGFYLSHQVRNNKKTAILALDVSTGRKKNEKSPEKKPLNIESPEKKAVNIESKIFAIHRPNTGLQIKHESYEELKKKYKKANKEEAKKFWEAQYVASLTTCSHAYWQGNCRRVSMGHECDIGTRRRTYHILCGLVLNVWAQVENVLAGSSGRNNKMQVIRVKTTDGDKLVGTLIPNMLVKIMTNVLDQNSENVFERTFEVDDYSLLLETSQPNIGEIVLDGSEEESDNEEKDLRKFSQNNLQNLKENVKHEVKSNNTVDLDNSSLYNSNMNVSISEGNNSIKEEIKRNTLSSDSFLSPEQNGDSLNRKVKMEDMGKEHLVSFPESSTPIKYRYLSPEQNCDSLNSHVKLEESRNLPLKSFLAKLEESRNLPLNSFLENSTAVSITPLKSDFSEDVILNSFPESSTAISSTPLKSDFNEDVKLNFKWDKDKGKNEFRLKNDFTREEHSDAIFSDGENSSENDLNIDERTYDSENDFAEEQNV